MGTHKTLLSQMVSSVEGSAMYGAAPSGAAAPKIFLLHSESVHSEMILAVLSQHRIQPFPPLPIHTHPYPPSLHKCRAHLSPPLHLLRLCLLSHSLYRSPPPTNPPHDRHTTFLPYPLYPPKTYTLQVSCKAIRRTSGGLTLPSLLTVKV